MTDFQVQQVQVPLATVASATKVLVLRAPEPKEGGGYHIDGLSVVNGSIGGAGGDLTNSGFQANLIKYNSAGVSQGTVATCGGTVATRGVPFGTATGLGAFIEAGSYVVVDTTAVSGGTIWAPATVIVRYSMGRGAV